MTGNTQRTTFRIALVDHRPAARGLEISDEQARILYAARRGAMHRNEFYRWVIDGDERPDRKDRERLTKRDMLTEFNDGQAGITERGERALAAYAEANEQ